MNDRLAIIAIFVLTLVSTFTAEGVVGKIGSLLANGLQLYSWYKSAEILPINFLVIIAGVYVIAVLIQWLIKRKFSARDVGAMLSSMFLAFILHNNAPTIILNTGNTDFISDPTITATYNHYAANPTSTVVLPVETSTPTVIQSMPAVFRASNLAKNQRHDVYTAPSTSSYRATSSKGTPAYVSTDDWINVYAKEGDWYLIEYELNKDLGNRIGYIHSSNFPVQANALDLPENRMSASIIRETSITDDPNCYARSLFSLSSGSSVNVICMMGGWHYIETYINNQQVRGFVQASNVAVN